MMLSLMQQNNLISETDMKLAQSLPLDVVPVDAQRARVRFPAFVDLVYQQLGEKTSPKTASTSSPPLTRSSSKKPRKP